MTTAETSTSFQQVPIVDVSSRLGSKHERRALGTKLADVLHTVGFCIITHHSVPSSLVKQVFEESQNFFSLPVEKKQLLDKRQSRHFRGWEPVGAESTNGQKDWREQIDLWTEHAPSEINKKYHSLLGPNQWPPESLVPNFYPTLTKWFQVMQELGDSLMGLFALGFGLPETKFDDLFGKERMSLVKLIRYPPGDGFGVNAHHDTGFLTILVPDSPGLEVQNMNGDWIPVPVIPDSFVINVGEALQSMTGNYLVATPHRVRVITCAERYSCGYFHGPSLDTPLAPLQELPPLIRQAVQTSPYHAKAGYMTQTGTDDENGIYKEYNPQEQPNTWGDLVWNYLSRSYPELMQKCYPSE